MYQDVATDIVCQAWENQVQRERSRESSQNATPRLRLQKMLLLPLQLQQVAIWFNTRTNHIKQDSQVTQNIILYQYMNANKILTEYAGLWKVMCNISSWLFAFCCWKFNWISKSLTRKRGNCACVATWRPPDSATVDIWAVFGHVHVGLLRLRINCYVWASDQYSDITIGLSNPDFKKKEI